MTFTLTASEAVTVSGGAPTLTLNDGGVATYASGSGTNALVFNYTVGAGQTTASLAATAVNLNGATIADGAGNAANLSLTGLTQTGPQIGHPIKLSSEKVNITGKAQEGQTLSANVTVNDPNAAISYQWQYQNGAIWTNISGATNSTVPLGVAQEGEVLRVVATAVDAGVTLSNASSPTAAVQTKAPGITILNRSLSVAAGGAVPLGVRVTIPEAGDTVSVKISGLPSYETISDALDGRVFSGSSINLTAAEVNSGLTLKSNYTGARHPVATLNITAINGPIGSSSDATTTLSLTVTDPPSNPSASGGANFTYFSLPDDLGHSHFESGSTAIGQLPDSVLQTDIVALLSHPSLGFASEGGGSVVGIGNALCGSLTAQSPTEHTDFSGNRIGISGSGWF